MEQILQNAKRQPDEGDLDKSLKSALQPIDQELQMVQRQINPGQPESLQGAIQQAKEESPGEQLDCQLNSLEVGD